MDTTEPDTIETAPPPPCPPSIPDELWERIPPARRQEALEFAARNLRRAFHPELSIRTFLKRMGITDLPA